MNNKHKFFKAGFTLVELLVVISIIGILASIALVSFRSAQFRSRDAQRKSDLKQLTSALELFYADYGRYPASVNGQIAGCPSTTASLCTWGSSEFTDTKTTYFKVLPKDPVTGHVYYYNSVTVNSVANSGYQIYAYLENPQDSSIITTVISCGGSVMCNFALTSPNTTP
jgi:type II secretion system protein G